MRIEQPAPVRKPLPLTPLVDVVFLLLMYFMLSSTFTRFGDLDMLKSSATQKQQSTTEDKAAKPGVILVVAAGKSYRINGVETATADIATALDRFHDLGVRSGVVVLSPTAEVQDLVSALEQARRSKLSALTVMQ